MMTEEDQDKAMLDRRGLIGAAGVGLLLAGCGGPQAGNEVNGMAAAAGDALGNGTARIIPFGECPDWGHSVNKRLSEVGRTFTPKLMCAIYLKLGNGPAPTVKHAYYELQGNETQATLDDYAKKMLLKLGGVQNSITFYQEDASANPPRTGVRNNFFRLSFDRPTIIYVFLDDPDTVAKFMADASLGEDVNRGHVIRFTPKAGAALYPSALRVVPFRDVELNHNFYEITRVPINTTMPGKAAYRFAYLNLKEGSATDEISGIDPHDPDDWVVYSMNIHLLVKPAIPPTGEEPAWIPIVFDPDTGNMGSNP